MEISYGYNKIKELAKLTLKAGRTPAIWGAPGIGKSTMGRELAEELNARLCILDVPLLQPFDYAVAVPNHDSKTVELYPTGFLPTNERALILIEDLPLAKPYQMIPVMQMVLDKRIGNIRFSDEVRFVITGNREEDTPEVNPLPTPLNNRLSHFNLDADYEEWVIWGKKNGIEESITGFITPQPQFILTQPKDGEKAFASPRSWHCLSDEIKGIKKEWQLRALAHANVGVQASQMYITWFKYLKDINPVDILENRGYMSYSTDRAKIFAVIQSVSAHIKQKKGEYIAKFKNEIEGFFNWLSGEFKIVFLKELVEHTKTSSKIDKLIEFAEQIPSAVNYVGQIRDRNNED